MNNRPPASPQVASAALRDCYREAAGSEALLRAFLAERASDSGGVRFWIEVYREITKGTGEGR